MYMQDDFGRRLSIVFLFNVGILNSDMILFVLNFIFLSFLQDLKVRVSRYHHLYLDSLGFSFCLKILSLIYCNLMCIQVL